VLHDQSAAAQTDERYASEMILLHDLARLGEPEKVVERLAELSSIIDGDLVSVLADHARAVVARSRTGIESVATQFANMGLTILAAEAANQSATACRREGLTRKAGAWDLRVASLRQLCGEVRTPILSDTGDVQLLTAREREIAELAAAGATTKEIAQRLYISPRTAENHLQRAFAKLGVNRRDQLVAALSIVVADPHDA